MPRLAVALLILLASWIQPAAACEEDLADPDTVQVLQPSFRLTRQDGSAMLTVMGTFRNTGPSKADDLVVEAKFVDAQGHVVDVLSEPVYGVAVPAGREVAFRMQGKAAAAEASYAAVQARVASGDACMARAERAPVKKTPLWVDLLVSWLPMIVLILVWVLLARKFNGKGSTQFKMLEAVNQQNALLARQMAAVEAIAAVAANAPSHSPT